MAITINEFTPSVEILETDFITQADDKLRTITNEMGDFIETETQSSVTQMETELNTAKSSFVTEVDNLLVSVNARVDNVLSGVTDNENLTYKAEYVDLNFIKQEISEYVRTINNPNIDTSSSSDGFGLNISSNDNYIVVSANREDTPATDSGVAYVYDYDGNLIDTIFTPDQSEENFASQVAINSYNEIYISHYALKTVYKYVLSNGSWVVDSSVTDTAWYFGRMINITDNIVVVFDSNSFFVYDRDLVFIKEITYSDIGYSFSSEHNYAGIPYSLFIDVTDDYIVAFGDNNKDLVLIDIDTSSVVFAKNFPDYDAYDNYNKSQRLKLTDDYVIFSVGTSINIYSIMDGSLIHSITENSTNSAGGTLHDIGRTIAVDGKYLYADMWYESPQGAILYKYYLKDFTKAEAIDRLASSLRTFTMSSSVSGNKLVLSDLSGDKVQVFNLKNQIKIDEIPIYDENKLEIEKTLIARAGTEVVVVDDNYIDLDAVGANPTAKLYSDGSIVGSTDNGSYVKWANGEFDFYSISYNFTTDALVGSAQGTLGSNGQVHVSYNLITIPLAIQAIEIRARSFSSSGTNATWSALNNYYYSSNRILVRGFSGQPNRSGSTKVSIAGRWK